MDHIGVVHDTHDYEDEKNEEVAYDFGRSHWKSSRHFSLLLI